MYVTCTRNMLFAAIKVELESDLRKSSPLWGTHRILFHAVYGSVVFDASLYCSYTMSLDND